MSDELPTCCRCGAVMGQALIDRPTLDDPWQCTNKTGCSMRAVKRRAVEQAERAGYQRAINQLRDELAYKEWRERDMAQPASARSFWPDYSHAPRFADYLEANREAS